MFIIIIIIIIIVIIIIMNKASCRQEGRRGWERRGERVFLPASVKKHPSGYEDRLNNQLWKHQIWGWRAVSAAGLEGRGSSKRSVCSQKVQLARFQFEGLKSQIQVHRIMCRTS